jgi:hypothetical protein
MSNGFKTALAVSFFGLAMLVLAVVWAHLPVASHEDTKSGTNATKPITHTVTYKVDSYPEPKSKTLEDLQVASLTYQNESGGTDQIVVQLPWTLELKDQKAGRFEYLSAQKKETYLLIHVAIFVDGQLLQQANATGDFGIATASGQVPE